MKALAFNTSFKGCKDYYFPMLLVKKIHEKESCHVTKKIQMVKVGKHL